jgi:hypothetical protein
VVPAGSGSIGPFRDLVSESQIQKVESKQGRRYSEDVCLDISLVLNGDGISKKEVELSGDDCTSALNSTEYTSTCIAPSTLIQRTGITRRPSES